MGGGEHPPVTLDIEGSVGTAAVGRLPGSLRDGRALGLGTFIVRTHVGDFAIHLRVDGWKGPGTCHPALGPGRCQRDLGTAEAEFRVADLAIGHVEARLLIESERTNYAVTLLGEQFQVFVEDEYTRKLNMGRKAPALPSGDLFVSAPIPGLVVKVLVAEGDVVEEDQALVILEAMKMENEITAHRAGTVSTLNVTEGTSIATGETIALIE